MKIKQLFLQNINYENYSLEYGEEDIDFYLSSDDLLDQSEIDDLNDPLSYVSEIDKDGLIHIDDPAMSFFTEYTYEVEMENIIALWGGYRVSAYELYSDMFRLGDGYIQKNNEDNNGLKGNPIIYFKNDKDIRGHYRIMFEDSFREILEEAKEYDFSILNGISYFGRKRDQNHASKMFAMIIDLDYVDKDKLNNLLNAAFKVDAYPIPNYVVLSGSGIHLYYLFEEPIPLYPNIKLQLKNFKYALTEKIWNQYTSNNSQVQKQGIFQPFRIVDGKTKYTYNDVLMDKKGKVVFRARAYRLNEHPFNLNNLGEYIQEEFRVDEGKLFKESKLSLTEAKKKYPQWYEKVVEKKNTSVKKWDIQNKVNGDDPFALYNWWIRQIESGATFGHRYFCVMCLVIYGVKCNISLEKIKNDAYQLIPFLNDLNSMEPFTQDDVDSALDCFDDRYCTFPIKDIEALSGIIIARNKRNGRNQKLHLKGARAIQDINDEANGTNWRIGNGRKSKEYVVKNWKNHNPGNINKSQCARDTGLSRPTIIKWW